MADEPRRASSDRKPRPPARWRARAEASEGLSSVQVWRLTLLLVLLLYSPCNEAAYVDDLADVSRLLGDFVDALLDKVSLLAEIVIHSAADEQCHLLDEAPSCLYSSGSLRGDNRSINFKTDGDTRTVSPETCMQLEEIHKFPMAPEVSESAINPKELDKKEFGNNLDFLVKSLGDKITGKAESSCHIFDIGLSNEDLPVSEMEVCCASLSSCYATCGIQKLSCDEKFQQCLKSLCKQRYDYTNKTILTLETEKIRAGSGEGASQSHGSATLASSQGSREKGSNGGERARQQLGANYKQTNQGDVSNPLHSQREVKRLKDRYKACKLAIKVLIIGNLAFSCRKYKRAQYLSCCKGNKTSETTTRGTMPEARRPVAISPVTVRSDVAESETRTSAGTIASSSISTRTSTSTSTNANNNNNNNNNNYNDEDDPEADVSELADS